MTTVALETVPAVTEAEIYALAEEFGLACFAKEDDGAFRCNKAQATYLARSIRHALAALAEARARASR